MASIVIVTKQCYLICEAINYIAVNELEDDEKEDRLSLFNKPRRRRKGKKPVKSKVDMWSKRQYNIVIDFVPANGASPGGGMGRNIGNGNTATLNINVTGRDICLELFSHMVRQIREQLPDNKFLDEIVEQFFQENVTNDTKNG